MSIKAAFLVFLWKISGRLQLMKRPLLVCWVADTLLDFEKQERSEAIAGEITCQK
jgi:hypothetical protein